MSRSALGYHEALAAIVDSATPLSVESVPLEQCASRAMAAPVTSPVALPPWDNAGMDGYAVQRADVLGADGAARAEQMPIVLQVIGTVAAGADPHHLPEVRRGTAVRIMTGAPLPSGADAIIRIEDTDGGLDAVAVRDVRDATGRGNVRPRGEDVALGEHLFGVGTTITPSHLGVLASIGCANVSVFRQPRVTVLSSGDELVRLDRFDEVLAGRRIVSSSSYAMPALLQAAGAIVTVAPLVPDTLEAMIAAVESAVSGGCDLLITTGGVSVGAHDYTRDALLAVGGTVDFWRARIRPGGPLGTGRVHDTTWLGLPGNPVSTMVTGTLFASPLIRRLGGHASVHHRTVPVVMRDAYDTPAPLTYFVRVVLARGEGGVLEGRLAGAQGSNLLRPMADAQALLVVPETCGTVAAGDIFDAVILP